MPMAQPAFDIVKAANRQPQTHLRRVADAGCGAVPRRGQIMTIRLPLFDNMERTDASSRQHDEPWFAYLNRSSHRKATRIRGRLESWFERFPVKAQDDVRGRFRGDDDHAYRGATFELLIHELITRLDCIADVHPEIRGMDSRPDFFVRHKGQCCYVEATVIDPKDSPFVPNSLEEDVVAKINTLTSSHFRIFAQVDGKLTTPLSREKATQPFTELLSGHDPDEIQDLIDSKGRFAAPSRKIEHGTWSLQGWLRPIPPEKRGDGKSRTLVIGPARCEGVDSSTPVRRAAKKKARKYGCLDAPLVVAANVRDFSFDKDDEMEALFGKERISYVEERPDRPLKISRKPDGVWIQGGYQPRYTRLAAVLIFRDIAPWNLCDAPTCLYVNPFTGDKRLPDVLYRLPHARAHEDEIQWFDGENVGQLLGVGGD